MWAKKYLFYPIKWMSYTTAVLSLCLFTQEILFLDSHVKDRWEEYGFLNDQLKNLKG